MCRAATRCTGSASSGISTARLVNCCLKSYSARSAAQRRFRQRGDPRGELLRGCRARVPTAARPPPSRPPPRPRRGARRGRRGSAARRRPRRARAPARRGCRRRSAADPGSEPSARAVAIPTRRPVKEPGPMPTAIRSTASQPPAASAARSTSASSAVVCCGPPFSERPSSASYRTSPSRSRGDSGVGGRGVEPTPTAYQRLPTDPGTVKTKEPTRLPSTNQVTWCLPGMLEVILLT